MSRGAAPSRRTAILSLLLLGGATLAAAVPTWLSTTGATALDPEVEVAVAGTSAAPGVSAAALVLVAAALALGLVGRVGRWVVLAVAAVSGVVATVSALGVALDPEPSARSAVADATGVTELTAPVELTAAPWLAAALGVLTVLVAVWVAVGSRSWAEASTRHERAPGPTSGGSSTRPVPAPEPSGGAAPGAATPGTDRADPAGGTSPDEISDHDAWDALSRGEDPTDR
ncbi:Trp biosynthesis-associated membrane protein [Cellulosimicrobium protaetiae]|uniref:Trp biosynthesis-associated membrane protein n=1 Tax=Cellulosimicrobium protaetiae TaxID=2587808 RepID=A0A6M5UGA0_9MICO|nr:Trp biosynthesis-associated membrane protein [Cellulosimicrobium protaetiae]QJW36662.1 Trp biosynthesis-associated membrane protein [Cellulosimicrobium protaetiae]